MTVDPLSHGVEVPTGEPCLYWDGNVFTQGRTINGDEERGS